MQNITIIPILLSIAVGGAIGSVLRYAAGQLIMPVSSQGFPYAILIINIVGSFLMGFAVVATTAKFGDNVLIRHFLTVGLLGGFTTFSTFSLDVVTLLERGEIFTASLYIGFSVVFSIAALFLGLLLGRSVL